MSHARPAPLWIGGEPRETNEVEPVCCPHDDQPVRPVCVGSARDRDDAMTIAEAAAPRSRRLATWQRVEIFEAIVHHIDASAEELAGLVTRESGKPIRFSRAEVARAVVT